VSQSQGASLKQKQGERGFNKMSSRITYVAALDLNELLTEPPEARKAFKRACGFQVRDNISITIQDSSKRQRLHYHPRLATRA
jgi:hypothetical protein